MTGENLGGSGKVISATGPLVLQSIGGSVKLVSTVNGVQKELEVSSTGYVLGGNASVTGNLLVGGTLGVTGVSTLTSLVLSTTSSLISTNSVDAADNKSIEINGGGATGTTRGGAVTVFGNEVATFGGRVLVEAGNVTTGDIVIRTPNATGGTITFSTGGVARYSLSAGSGNFIQDATNGGNIVLTKASTAVVQPSADSLTAAGTIMTDALDLTAVSNRVTTTASGTGVQLWDAPVGSFVVVSNQGANALLVYASDAAHTINGVASNSLASGATAIYFRMGTIRWHRVG